MSQLNDEQLQLLASLKRGRTVSGAEVTVAKDLERLSLVDWYYQLNGDKIYQLMYLGRMMLEGRV